VFLYVDEFHNFVTHSFADILAEARKYRLGLVLSHQFSEQVHERIRAAILGNCGTMIFFRIGPDDAKLFAKEVEPHYTWSDLVNLSPHEVIYKVQRSGKVDRPYQAATIPPAAPSHADPEGWRRELIELSRRRYGRQRQQVEEKISRFFVFSN
jgi:DNA helicase HerA-like ATPase